MIKKARELPDRDWITVRELAETMGKTRATVYAWIDDGVVIPTEFKRKKASLYRFSRQEAERILERVRSGLPMSVSETVS